MNNIKGQGFSRKGIGIHNTIAHIETEVDQSNIHIVRRGVDMGIVHYGGHSCVPANPMNRSRNFPIIDNVLISYTRNIGFRVEKSADTQLIDFGQFEIGRVCENADRKTKHCY